jgi:hypothetical protein
MSSSSQFDASASMLGYIYQIRYGLYLSLKKLSDIAEPDSFNISIEKLDDIAFDLDGTAEELLQTKFHGNPGNLTNRSPDIWKTIRVWVESALTGDIEFGNTILTLITTQAIPDSSLASYLSATGSRDVNLALALMLEISEEDNKANAKGYQVFKSLTVAQRQVFLSSIQIVGRSDDLLKIRDRMLPIVRQSVPNEATGAFLERLEGTWFKWCIEVLSQTPTGVINLGCLQDLVDQLRPEYSRTNLPPEFSDVLPDVIDIEGDLRIFIQQLRLFNSPPRMIELAIINYYRAYEQRSKWSADGLLNPGELKRFDRRLFEKWQEQHAYLEAISAIKSEEEKKRFSVELYQYCQQNGVVPIRPEFMEGYLSKGSYHILSDELKIGWHPGFEMLGSASNEGAA